MLRKFRGAILATLMAVLAILAAVFPDTVLPEEGLVADFLDAIITAIEGVAPTVEGVLPAP